MYKILALALVLGLTASPVSALTVGAKSDTSGSVNVGSGVNVNVSSQTNVESNASSSADAGSNTETTWDVDAAGPTVIVAGDVKGDVDTSVKSSAEVTSKAKLDTYARSVVKANADIRDVILSDTEVSVSHREHARLFGILPIKVFARAYVSNDGSVKVKYPWYAFASANKASLESRVSAAVRSHLPSRQAGLPSVSADASASAKLSARTQAEVLEKTVAAMKTEFDAQASAKATAKVQ